MTETADGPTVRARAQMANEVMDRAFGAAMSALDDAVRIPDVMAAERAKLLMEAWRAARRTAWEC